MRDFIISTDSTAELSEQFIRDNNIMIHPISYTVDDKDYAYGREIMTDKDFYNCMREGKMPVTGASNPEYIRQIMNEAVVSGKDILHLSFSAALSSSYNNACMSANMVMEEHPEGRICVVDSSCVTAGQILIVKKVVELKNKGLSLAELVIWLEENKTKFVHEFIVQDLFHLVRGGRVSKTSAVLGSALKIQPLLHVNEEGALEPLAKIRGRKKAISTLVENMVQKTEGLETDRICIAHGDCIEDAEILRDMVKAKKPDAEVEIVCLCPTIGAHTGPGVLVLCYYANKR